MARKLSVKDLEEIARGETEKMELEATRDAVYAARQRAKCGALQVGERTIWDGKLPDTRVNLNDVRGS